LDEFAIKSEVCRKIMINNPSVYKLFSVYMKSQINEEAYSLLQSLLGMSLGGQSADEDAQFYDYHIDHFQIAFEE
jgi:hypothetical protein